MTADTDIAAQMQARGAIRKAQRRAVIAGLIQAERSGSVDAQALRLDRGDLELVDGADPDAPNRTVRRARVVCHYDALWKAGGLKHHEREAADRYAITCDRESGAREAVGGHVGAAAPWSRAPALTAVQAAASLRAAHEAVGRDGTALLRLYVRDNKTVQAIAADRGEQREVTKGRIVATIARLAEHWGMRDHDA